MEGKQKHVSLTALLLLLLPLLLSAQWLETTIPVGFSPRALVYNPTNNRIYCANSGNSWDPDSTVTVIDGATNTVIATIGVGDGPNALVYNPTNNKIYSANGGT
jgi:YVTN family beta-propeller protein